MIVSLLSQLQESLFGGEPRETELSKRSYGDWFKSSVPEGNSNGIWSAACGSKCPTPQTALDQ
eukprot:JP448719.1.p1 GENE.JP448719.1~~JP448719.1.p1  ORF type:complete len:70 (+),score=7.01 JP448719.1:23-211(+)